MRRRPNSCASRRSRTGTSPRCRSAADRCAAWRCISRGSTPPTANCSVRDWTVIWSAIRSGTRSVRTWRTHRCACTSGENDPDDVSIMVTVRGPDRGGGRADRPHVRAVPAVGAAHQAPGGSRAGLPSASRGAGRLRRRAPDRCGRRHRGMRDREHRVLRRNDRRLARCACPAGHHDAAGGAASGRRRRPHAPRPGAPARHRLVPRGVRHQLARDRSRRADRRRTPWPSTRT